MEYKWNVLHFIRVFQVFPYLPESYRLHIASIGSNMDDILHRMQSMSKLTIIRNTDQG